MDNSSLLNGRFVLITGGTSGIGFFTARALACMGATVFITGRDASRGQEAVRQIQATAGHKQVSFIQTDAATVGGNQKLAQQLLSEVDQLQILVNNVGGLYKDRWDTGDGYEATLAMNLLWTLALARRLEGSGITANVLHPGTAWTAMTQKNESRLLPANLRWLYPIFRLIQRRGFPEKAARTSIFLASAPEAVHYTGQYFESSTRPKQLPSDVLDLEKQEKTWEIAEALVQAAPSAVFNSVAEKV